MQVLPLGDQGAMLYCPDEQTALAVASRMRSRNFSWLVDVVQAYTSVAVYFDLHATNFFSVAEELGPLLRDVETSHETAAGTLHSIPCCYGLALDLQRIAEVTGLAEDEVVGLHASNIYTVYAIGFCPGFPYLGYLPEKLCGVPRLPSPRLRVEPGSVGLTGRQTGIYTEARPGGWNIVGRTPLTLVDVVAGYFPLRTGDRVQFRPITLDEHEQLKGKTLETT